MTTAPVQLTRSTCPYCGVGCGVIIESRGAQIIGVRGDPDHPANFGRLCTKGSTLHLTATETLARQTRLLQPMRRPQRGHPPQPIDWDSALDEVAQRLGEIVDRHGPDAVGFYISGQLLTEDYYVFNKLAKGLIGTNNIDTNSRLCMSSAVAGYKLTLGADAPPACYEDIDHAEVIFIVGANPAWAHPILFRRLEDAKRANPRLRLIVADPRRTETAELADLYLPLQPGTDVALFHGMLHVLIWEQLIDPGYIAAHTEGFDALRQRVLDFPPARAAQLCGIDAAALVQAARWFGQSHATLSLYCQGLNQSHSGTAKNAALINLHLATGHIGRPGAGPFSLTGQPNAMGGREVGGMANLLSAHRDLANPEHRAEVARLWGVAEVPATPGTTAVEMFGAAARGEIKALWIACTNPAQSMPDQAAVRRAMQRCEFVVVQEAFATTATGAYADMLLPASTWGEKEGTVTNSERRISRVRAAIPAPGQARPDWRIVVDVARRLEARWPQRLNGRHTLFPYDGPEAIWNEHRESTRGRDLDITGLSYALLEHAPQQWPCPEGGGPQARLYMDGRFATANGRARFADVDFVPVAEPRDARYPFSLITGRLRDHWHGMSRTGLLGRLFGHVSEPAVQLHPQDMARLGLQDGDLVHLTSRRGSIVLPAQGSEQVGPCQAFMAMHWGEECLSGASSSGERLAGVNALTLPTFCPTAKQPELKHAAVKVLKAELPWTLLAAAWLPLDQAHRALAALRALMPRFAYATCVPFGREPHERGVLGVQLRAAAYEPAADELLAHIEAIMGLDASDVLRYADRRRGQRRAMRLVPRAEGQPDLLLEAFLLAGDTRAERWVRALLHDELPAQAYGRALLVPSAEPPSALAPRSRQVCTCLNVTESDIVATLAQCHGSAEERLAQLQAQRRCGTQCGSCLPELRRLVRASLQVA
ncbi:nitrate reductase [Tepidimonas aquatica]|uniref:Nitrate reductase n=1 Tax=Tepidimonas aquatica TaxID=247482 RepID=A0A554WU75_9BURK|nr:nitrate reductase [Tepidimonas aquatica]TSE27140.1 Nitrate reductase [Tepidimonas aquatica]